MMEVEIIIYVKDRQKSRWFYENLLDISPVLDVPGMTEFKLNNTIKLGIMPEDGIAKIITPSLPHPREGSGIPRCELYLKVHNPVRYISKAIALGGKEISTFQDRDWGDKVGYVTDLDGHILAFAESETT